MERTEEHEVTAAVRRAFVAGPLCAKAVEGVPYERVKKWMSGEKQPRAWELRAILPGLLRAAGGDDLRKGCRTRLHNRHAQRRRAAGGGQPHRRPELVLLPGAGPDPARRGLLPAGRSSARAPGSGGGPG